MLDIYTTTDPNLIKKGRLWRIIAPNGVTNYCFSTVHADSKLLLSGTPEFNYIFNLVKKIVFEYPDMQEIASEAERDLETVLKSQIPEEILDYTREIEVKYPAAYKSVREELINTIVSYYDQNNILTEEKKRGLQAVHFVPLIELCIKISLYKVPDINSFDNCLWHEAKLKLNSGLLKEVSNIEPFLNIINSNLKGYLVANGKFLTETILALQGHKNLSRKNNIVFQEEYIANLLFIYFSGMWTEKSISSELESACYKERNLLLFDNLKDKFLHGDYLFISGIEHLVGQDSILELLQKNGYKVERILETLNAHYCYDTIKDGVAHSVLLLLCSFLGAYYYMQKTYENNPITVTIGIILINLACLAYRVLFQFGFMDAMICNSAPLISRNHVINRLETLYANSEPVISRSILTDFMQKRKDQQHKLIPIDKPATKPSIQLHDSLNKKNHKLKPI